MIDIILGLVIGGFALAATFMLPSKTQIQNNQAPKYKSYKNVIYAAGVTALIGGVVFLLLYIMDEVYQDILNLLKMAFLVVIGIVLITSNKKRSKFLAECEVVGYIQPGAVAPPIMPGMPLQPQVPGQVAQPVMAQTQPVSQVTTQKIPAQQIGVKAQQIVQPQTIPVQTAPEQQIGIKGQTQVARPKQGATQPQAVAQPQHVAQPQTAQKPRIIVINCPRCKGKMQLDTRMMGQKMKCPHCGIEGKIG